MPSNTTRNSLPYPNETDVISVAGSGQDLATAIDSHIDRFRHSTGSKFIHNMAMWEESNTNLTGYVVINTDIPFAAGSGADKMLRIDIRGYVYYPYNNVIDATFNFYMLNGGLQSPDFVNKGSMTFSDVRILRNNTNNTLSLSLRPELPAGSNIWNYPKMIADGWISWSTEISDTQFKDFYIVRVADLTNYTTIQTLASGQWNLLTLVNGWVSYDSGAHAIPRYRRVGARVFVEGVIRTGAGTGTIATLPQGFRHTGNKLIFNQSSAGSPGTGRVDVYSGGEIVANGVPDNGYLSLNGITFPIGNTT